MSHYFFPGKLQAGQRQERLCKNKDPISTESIFTLCRKVDEDVLLQIFVVFTFRGPS